MNMLSIYSELKLMILTKLYSLIVIVLIPELQQELLELDSATCPIDDEPVWNSSRNSVPWNSIRNYYRVIDGR